MFSDDSPSHRHRRSYYAEHEDSIARQFHLHRRRYSESLMLCSGIAAIRACVVTYIDHRQIRHGAEVQAESLYEAAVLAIKLFREDPWLERIGPATVLDVEVREPGTKHAIWA